MSDLADRAMTDHDIEELVEVTQADRIVAAETSGEFYTLGFHDDVLSGLRDDHPYVQTIARHRAQALTALQAENEHLRGGQSVYHAILRYGVESYRKTGTYPPEVLAAAELLERLFPECQALKDRAGKEDQ
jgi:hypothetical protein